MCLINGVPAINWNIHSKLLTVKLAVQSMVSISEENMNISARFWLFYLCLRFMYQVVNTKGELVSGSQTIFWSLYCIYLH